MCSAVYVKFLYQSLYLLAAKEREREREREEFITSTPLYLFEINIRDFIIRNIISGVPNPNGKRHASEIASLSLDILEHVNRMEIPHIPGTNVRLRIGCHSGKIFIT